MLERALEDFLPDAFDEARVRGDVGQYPRPRAVAEPRGLGEVLGDERWPARRGDPAASETPVHEEPRLHLADERPLYPDARVEVRTEHLLLEREPHRVADPAVD